MSGIIVCVALIVAGIVAVLKLHFNSCKPKGKFRVKIFFNNIIIQGERIMVSFSYSQKVSVEIIPQDANGNPAQVEMGSVNIASSDESVCRVVRDPDNETKFEILGSNDGTVGVAQIDISADADLGDGVETITGFIGVEITAKHAVGFGMTIGEPVEQG
jgi:hypothetical protein